MKNWIKEAKEYAEFLELDIPSKISTKQAKEWIEETIYFLIATNGGTEYLFQRELDYIKELKLIIKRK